MWLLCCYVNIAAAERGLFFAVLPLYEGTDSEVLLEVA